MIENCKNTRGTIRRKIVGFDMAVNINVEKYIYGDIVFLKHHILHSIHS